MRYSLRPTGLSNDPRAEDYQAFAGDAPIGRLYSDTFAGQKRWRWSIYINHRTQPHEGVALMGYADTRDQATAAFKQSFEALIAAGKVTL